MIPASGDRPANDPAHRARSDDLVEVLPIIQLTPKLMLNASPAIRGSRIGDVDAVEC